MTKRSRTELGSAAQDGVRLDHADQLALAEYLGTLRDAGPALDEALLKAFEQLTPHQLDALVLTMTAAESPARAEAESATNATRAAGAAGAAGAEGTATAPSGPHAVGGRRRRLSGTAQLVLAAAVACLVCAGGVLAAGLAFGGPAGASPAGAEPGVTSTSTSITDLSGLDWADGDDGF